MSPQPESLELGLFLGPPSQFAWGVRRDDTALRSALNDHLALARNSGAWRRLVIRYFGDAAVDMLKRAETR